MHEGLELKTTPSEEVIAIERFEKDTSPEAEVVEADMLLEKATTDVEEFINSGLPIAETIATEMGAEIDLETQISLVELNQQAELARQILADSFIGKLRLKSADFLKKYFPGSGLTKLVEQKNTKTVSKKTTEKLQEFLKFDGLDYTDADEAVNYFEKHRDLLVGEDKDKLESRVLEATTVHEERKAELLSARIVEELQELLKCEDGSYDQIIQAVYYFEKHKDLIIGYARQSQERRVFSAVEVYLLNIADDTEDSWKETLSEYKKIPNDFLDNKDISRIGYHIYYKAKDCSVKPKDMLVAFDGNLDLLAAGSRNRNDYDDFSSEDRVKIIEETYKKRGASEYIARYNDLDFKDKDREIILKPLFESYKIYDQKKILYQIDSMKDLYDSLPQEERDDLVENLIEGCDDSNLDYTFQVVNKLDKLNFDGEQKKRLVEKLIQNKNYQYLESEKNLEKLGVSKDEIFNELLENDAIGLFARREVFNPSTEQYKLLFDSVTSNIASLEKTLYKINRDNSSDIKKLTEEEVQIFQTIIEKDAPDLIFKFKNFFKEGYKGKVNQFFKELPKGLSENGLEEFVLRVVEDFGGWEKNIERMRALAVEANEQKVTNEYLEQLDGVGLKLPNRVMGKIKENVKKAERERLLDHFKRAFEKNVTLEQIQREDQQKLEQVTTQADYFKAVHPNVLKSVLKDRRFKTQFETHSSNGTLDPDYRAQEEAKMFNYVNDKEKGNTVRPNYGYMSDNEHGLVGNFSEDYIDSNVSNYGCIHVKFKKEQIAGRTTVTFNDSLGEVDNAPPSPSIKPHFTSLDRRHNIDKVKNASKPGDWEAFYLEVQYHWPLRTSLIDSIHISAKNRLGKEGVYEIEEMVKNYNEQNPDNKIKVITY